MEGLKTERGHPIIVGKFYELTYKWGKGWKYGYGWINPDPKANCGNIDIICHDGGVTFQDIENVTFLFQLRN